MLPTPYNWFILPERGTEIAKVRRDACRAGVGVCNIFKTLVFPGPRALSYVHCDHGFCSSRVVFGEPRLLADDSLLALAFASNDVLASVEEPGVLRHWDVRTGQQLDWQCLSELETVWAFGRDARVLVSGSDELTLWDGLSSEVVTGAPQKSWITALAVSADGRFIATGHDDGAVRYLVRRRATPDSATGMGSPSERHQRRRFQS